MNQNCFYRRSETRVVRLIRERITAGKVGSGKSGTVVSVEEYRRITKDYESPDELIEERLQYLESFCRNIARHDVKKFYEQSKKNFLFTKNR